MFCALFNWNILILSVFRMCWLVTGWSVTTSRSWSCRWCQDCVLTMWEWPSWPRTPSTWRPRWSLTMGQSIMWTGYLRRHWSSGGVLATILSSPCLLPTLSSAPVLSTRLDQSETSDNLSCSVIWTESGKSNILGHKRLETIIDTVGVLGLPWSVSQ